MLTIAAVPIAAIFPSCTIITRVGDRRRARTVDDPGTDECLVDGRASWADGLDWGAAQRQNEHKCLRHADIAVAQRLTTVTVTFDGYCFE